MKSTNMFVTEHMNAQTDLTAAVIGFCRFLRRQSFRVGVAETLAALEACRVGPLDQRSYLRAALRALLCSSCLLYTSPSPRDATLSRMPSSA